MMPLHRSPLRSLFLVVTLLMVGTSVLSAQEAKLGKVAFPTTGSPEAQAHFLRGLAALHSFWYEEALEAFRDSTKADPKFLMGYWGEAMAHNHPLWSEQDTEAARQVLAKIKDVSKVTPRERAYLNAVKVLYGEGDKLARDQAYAAAMEKLYRDYPDDLEAASFYSLSLLGTVRPGDKGYRRQAQAGAIALEVYQKNPNHPGAAHYIIHAFDDPEHAILALPAAFRYAEIAPEAHHARHMPAHIFLQLGMWPEAAASNESAWAVSDAWVKRKNLPITRRDYHSLHWLTYVYLQQGRFSKAHELLAMMQQHIKEMVEVRRRGYASLAASYVVETGQWDLAAKLFGAEAKAGASGGYGAMDHTAHNAPPKPAGQQPANTTRPQSDFLPAYIRGLAAAATGVPAEVDKSLTELRTIRQGLEKSNPYRAKMVEVMELSVAATASAHKKDYDEAGKLMKRATALEEELSPPSGPPDLIKPSHELYGEILLRAGRAKEAAEQFQIALLRQPNRARSLLGAARAAQQNGDRTGAAAAYGKLLEIWKQADEQLPERREAQSFMAQVSAR